MVIRWVVALANAFNVLALANAFLHDVMMWHSHPCFLISDLHEVLQRARLSYNPRGTCPCWSEIQPRRVGQSPSPNSYIARKIGVGGRQMVIGWVFALFIALPGVALANALSCFSSRFSSILTSEPP
jgi:hypothetical protein